MSYEVNPHACRNCGSLDVRHMETRTTPAICRVKNSAGQIVMHAISVWHPVFFCARHAPLAAALAPKEKP